MCISGIEDALGIEFSEENKQVILYESINKTGFENAQKKGNNQILVIFCINIQSFKFVCVRILSIKMT
jgi:hypothetical protein